MLTLYSGVLAASIERSRQKWCTEGVFERYWAKPSRKKNVGDAPNPAKETMTKLGICSMIIEPHVFEITLYTVKDLFPSIPIPNTQPPLLSAPQYNPFAPSSIYSAPLYNTPPADPHHPYQGQQYPGISQPSLPPFREGFGQLGSQGQPPIYHAPLPAAAPSAPPGFPNLQKLDGGVSDVAEGREFEPKTDPVIQMLATRAASDHQLKSLMKVVATGKASQDELKVFQNHIDELNTILKSRQSPTMTLQNGSHPKSPPPGSQIHESRLSMPAMTPHMTPGREVLAPASAPADPRTIPMKVEPFSQTFSNPIPPMNMKPPGAYKPDIHAIVFDFGGNGDRFSFPRFSVLEYLYHGTQVIVSFLIIRRGSMAVSGKYKDTRSYYQPVTMRLSTPHSKILEPLARIVAPLDEVRRYMDSVFDKMSRADTCFLATRLPRAPDSAEVEKQESSNQQETKLIKPVYSPPNALAPLAA